MGPPHTVHVSRLWDALGEVRYYQDQLRVARIDFISYAKYKAQQASSERMRSCTHSVESTGGQQALRPDQGEATNARRVAIGVVPIGTQEAE
ncbi:hypothetical protein KI387_000312, partial [Taxus chinensis]